VVRQAILNYHLLLKLSLIARKRNPIHTPLPETVFTTTHTARNSLSLTFTWWGGVFTPSSDMEGTLLGMGDPWEREQLEQRKGRTTVVGGYTLFFFCT